MTFKITHKDKRARVGKFTTKSGTYETPFFMPVATKAAPKYIEPAEIKKMGGYAMISNAFLMYLKPGAKVIKKHGGLGKFMNWDGCTFTDSGGFQVLSLNTFKSKFSDDGLLFKSPFDGSKHLLNPKTVMKFEQDIGADVAMVIDQMPLADQDKKGVIEATNRTHLWAKECLKYHKDKKQLLFGICQGGVYPELRKASAEYIGSLPFDGCAIGGLAVGEAKSDMKKMVKIATDTLPENKPRYLMGVGTPRELIDFIEMGVDVFDCIWPTRTARHGKMMTQNGYLTLKSTKYKFDMKPIDKHCDCYVCKTLTRSYLHHLLRQKEPLGMKYLSYHNLHFLQNLMKEIREAIKKGELSKLKKKYKKYK